MKSSTIFLVITLSAFLVDCEEEAKDSSELDKCGEGLEKLYNKVCGEKEEGAKKLFAIRTLCFTYPAKVMKHKDIVEIMNFCNAEDMVCDKKKMSECGQRQFEYAAGNYSEKAKKEKLEDATLPEMFANSQKEVAAACNETLVCFEGKAEAKLVDLTKEMEKKKKDDEEKEKKEKEEAKKKE